MKKFWKRNWTSVVLSLAIGGVILTADIMSRPYAAFGGGGLLFIAIVVYWFARLEGEKAC